MNLEEALQGWREFAAIKYNKRTLSHSLECVETILAALRACQREKREMFKRLCVQCIYNEPECTGDKCTKNNILLATIRNCPLLEKEDTK